MVRSFLISIGTTSLQVAHWLISHKWATIDTTIYTAAVTAYIGMIDIEGWAKTSLFCIAVLMASVRCTHLIVTKCIDMHGKYMKWKRDRERLKDV